MTDQGQNVSNAKLFQNTPIVLFFTHKDLFRKKIVEEQVDLSKTFADYSGNCSIVSHCISRWFRF